MRQLTASHFHAGPRIEGAYDPSQFTTLDVKADVRDLFQFITECVRGKCHNQLH